MRPAKHKFIFDINNQIYYQLEPPDTYRRNAAERFIRKRNNNFVSDLSGTNNMLPMHLWDRLREKAYITLNMLRTSRRNPNISLHAIMEENVDFNKTLLAPPGPRVIFHENPNRRRTWNHSGVQGLYIGPWVYTYRCYKVYISNTKV